MGLTFSLYITTLQWPITVDSLSDKIRKAEAEKEPLKASDIFASESEEESSSSDDSDSYQNSEDEAGTK